MKTLRLTHIIFRRQILTLFALICCAGIIRASLPQYSVAPENSFPAVAPGTSTRLIVNSAAFGDEMIVDIWFPPAYSPSAPGGFPVIYAHDGQNLFDPAKSYSSVAWELDKTCADLADKGLITPPIVVGIHNRGEKNLRPNDYFPEKAALLISDPQKTESCIWDTCASGFLGDEHAAFVATKLKPLIYHLYNTASDRSHTFAIGSSMGGLASLYLLCEYPWIFGGAACLSTHWVGSLSIDSDFTMHPDPLCSEAILSYMDQNLPDPATHKLYLDEGTAGWDAGYLPYEEKARAIARNHGYSETDASLMTFDAVGADHNEWFWQQRVDRPLKFLLGNPKSGLKPIAVNDAESYAPAYLPNGILATTDTPRGIRLSRHSRSLTPQSH